MNFVRDLQRVSEFLFYMMGVMIAVAFLFWHNESFVYEAELFLRHVDLPFVLVCILFLTSSIRLSLARGGKGDYDRPILDMGLILVGMSVFFLVVYIDFALPDVV